MPLASTPTARQAELRTKARRFAEDVLRDVTASAEQLSTPAERFAATKPAYERLVSDGFLRACIRETAGGDRSCLTDVALLAEELFCGSPGVALTLVGTVLGLQPVVVGGTREQQSRLLAPFLTGHGAPLAGFCSSEPGGSANAGSPPPGEGVRTAARVDGDDWIIDGRKRWVSSATGWDGGGADLLCVVARTGPAVAPGEGVSVLAVEGPVDGLVLEGVIDSPGFRAHFLPDFSLRAVRTSRRNLIGREGAGLRLVAESFADASALVGVMGVALMRAAFDHALQFAKSERRGGAVPIIDHQAVGYELVHAKVRMEACRSLTWRACRGIDEGSGAAAELANCAKIFVSETAVSVITDLTRVVGVESYDLSNPLNGLLQDALALPVFGGGNLGVRRRALHALIQSAEYDPLTSSDVS
ncbi:acyl-CoA dehydrogenase family protein [Petropleomorpha daqingensis]|uniref:acyl-CoA dehydrogenase family protein n=1 Tax=Petropleomorpha daqingensis TaxID=2026353 RepID=UPI0015CB98EC|nr:acyl-CoA dehydrogenase [Petropleomorpha daqingensis]